MKLLLALSIAWPLAAQTQAARYVSPNGSDSNDGSPAAPFRTIQRAIDASGARGSSAVIVLEGRYTGAGNTNLDFRGKAVTVTSRNPSDPRCTAATILDAAGKGVIARFVNREGPGTAIGGFTLIAGDAGKAISGVAGLFEIGPGARPTSWNLRLGAPLPPASAPAKVQAGDYFGAPIGGRAWDGNNPFFQPSATTDYLGSGDVNGDGVVTSSDAGLVLQMATGMTSPMPAADADGGGTVDNTDVGLVFGAASGGTLPGWWNKLTTRAQRDAWVDKVLARDTTNQRYWSQQFQCLNFSYQAFIRAAGYRNDLSGSIYNGGQALYNIPLYSVEVPGHSINAILVGDNPLSLDDWRIIEPQNDFTITPGTIYLAYGSTVKIHAPNWVHGTGGGYMGEEYKVEFQIGGTGGWTLTGHSPDLAPVRPATPVGPVENRPDLWNARVVPYASGLVLFDRQRADMSRMNDIHIADFPFTDPPSGKALVQGTDYSRLIDVTRDSSGAVRLLWRGGVPGPQYSEGVFTGVLNTATRTLQSVTQLTPALRHIRSGRIVARGSEVHAFWAATPALGMSYSNGIYWSKWNGVAWTPEQLVAPVARNPYDWGDWTLTDSFRYQFDVTAAGDGNLVLVWCDRDSSTGDVTFRQDTYNGAWSAASAIESTSEDGGGVALARDAGGYVHLAYWRGAELRPTSATYDYGSQVLYHRRLLSPLSTSPWSAATVVDGSGFATSPHMTYAGFDGLYLVWQRYTGTQFVPAWKKYSGGGWSAEQVVPVQPGTDAHYPRVEVMPDFRIAFTWSARSLNRATISWAYAPAPALSIAKTHTGSFTHGQTGAMYTVKVSNAASAGPSFGIVAVEEWPQAGLALASMSGAGWNCAASRCERYDLLNPGTSYPPIVVTVNVAATAPAQVTNKATVSGGGSATATATDVANVY